MRRALFILAAVTLFSAPVFANGTMEGFGGNGSQKKHAVMGVSGLGGSAYPVMAIISGLVEKHTDSKVVVQTTGGGTENIRLMRQGQIQMGYAEANVMVYGYEGIDLFTDNAYTDMRFVANAYPLVFQAVVYKKSKVKTIRDLKGHSFSPGSAGSGDESGWAEIFNAVGLNKDNVKWKPLTHTERAMAFKDRSLNSIGYETSCPSGSILEASAQIPIRLLSISGEDRNKVFEMYPWYSPWTVPAGTYNGQDEDVDTIVVGAGIMADANLDPAVIYDWLYSMYDTELESVQNVHAMSKYISLESALNGKGSVPLHEGASTFYKEKGMIN
jgi:TRAP transporter TAXI family solute receptor